MSKLKNSMCIEKLDYALFFFFVHEEDTFKTSIPVFCFILKYVTYLLMIMEGHCFPDEEHLMVL